MNTKQKTRVMRRLVRAYNLKAKTEGDAKKELENLYLKQVVGKEKKETNEGEGLK